MFIFYLFIFFYYDLTLNLSFCIVSSSHPPIHKRLSSENREASPSSPERRSVRRFTDNDTSSSSSQDDSSSDGELSDSSMTDTASTVIESESRRKEDSVSEEQMSNSPVFRSRHQERKQPEENCLQDTAEQLEPGEVGSPPPTSELAQAAQDTVPVESSSEPHEAADESTQDANPKGPVPPAPVSPFRFRGESTSISESPAEKDKAEGGKYFSIHESSVSNWLSKTAPLFQWQQQQRRRRSFLKMTTYLSCVSKMKIRYSVAKRTRQRVTV